MRDAAIRVHPQDETNSLTGAVPVSVLASPAPDALSLPDLGSVPSQMVVVSAKKWWNYCAVALLDAGLIDPAKVTRRGFSASRLAQQSLDAWVGSYLGTLNYIGVAFSLSDSPANAVGIELADERVAEARKQPFLLESGSFFCLGITPTDWGAVRIEAAITALEQKKRGLGETLWYYLARWLSDLCLNVITPRRTEEIQINHEWWGENDERECKMQFESEEDFNESGMLTRQEFDRLLPPIAVRPKRRLRMRTVKKMLAKGLFDERECKLVELVFRYMAAIGEGRFEAFFADGISESYDDNYMEQIAPSVFVRWNESDPTTRIFDDMANQYQQGAEGFYEGAEGLECFAFSDPDSFRQWMAKAQRHFRAISLLDQMLTIIESYNK